MEFPFFNKRALFTNTFIWLYGKFTKNQNISVKCQIDFSPKINNKENSDIKIEILKYYVADLRVDWISSEFDVILLSSTFFFFI